MRFADWFYGLDWWAQALAWLALAFVFLWAGTINVRAVARMNRPRGLQYARGRDLDALVERLGYSRKRYFWPFRELDNTLRMRVLRDAFPRRPRH
jgi:hypothetical protein